MPGGGENLKEDPPPSPSHWQACTANIMNWELWSLITSGYYCRCTVQYSALTFKEKYQELIVDNL